MIIRIILLGCFVFIFSDTLFGQYWIGPKIGISYINHIYQSEKYESDSFNVKNNINFQVGISMSYTATDVYSVYGELVYERIGKVLRDKETDGDKVYADMTNYFISLPLMLRVTLGTEPLHYYVNGGPRISYWLGGKGTHDLDVFDEFPVREDENGNSLPVDYKLIFDSNNLNVDGHSTAYIRDPNRVQFGLAVGGGMLFDLITGGRLMIDFRYTWIHSNLGTNTSDDANLIYGATNDDDFYRENLEYRNNIVTVGIGYLFGYNSDLKRKGKSTNKESNKNRNKSIKKKKISR